MEFIIRRTSIWNNKKPCKEAYKTLVTYLDFRNVSSLDKARQCGWYKAWFESRENHREQGVILFVS